MRIIKAPLEIEVSNTMLHTIPSEKELQPLYRANTEGIKFDFSENNMLNSITINSMGAMLKNENASIIVGEPVKDIPCFTNIKNELLVRGFILEVTYSPDENIQSICLKRDILVAESESGFVTLRPNGVAVSKCSVSDERIGISDRVFKVNDNFTIIHNYGKTENRVLAYGKFKVFGIPINEIISKSESPTIPDFVSPKINFFVDEVSDNKEIITRVQLIYGKE